MSASPLLVTPSTNSGLYSDLQSLLQQSSTTSGAGKRWFGAGVLSPRRRASGNGFDCVESRLERRRESFHYKHNQFFRGEPQRPVESADAPNSARQSGRYR